MSAKRSYKFDIECENGKYRFVLYPNSSKRIPIGFSKYYDTRKDCETAFLRFRQFVKQHELNAPKDGFVEITKEVRDGVTVFKIYYLENGERIFTGRTDYTVRSNAREGINSIYEHIDYIKEA